MPFHPTDIIGCKLALEADGTLWQDSARTTPATADGDPVGAWDDASGLAEHPVQATSGKRPTLQTNELNGYPVIRFDGSDDFLQKTFASSISQPLTIFVVGKRTAAGTFVDGATAASILIRDIGTWNIYGGINLLGSSPDSNYHVFSAVFVSNSDGMLIDGSLNIPYGNAGSNSLDGITLGSWGNGTSELLTGDIAAVFVFNSALSETDRQKVERYLARKYDLANPEYLTDINEAVWESATRTEETSLGSFTDWMLAYVPLCEPGGPRSDFYNSTVFAENGTITGVSGLFGLAAEFNGTTEYLQAATNPFVGLAEFSFSAWVRFTKGSAVFQTDTVVYSFDAGPGDGFQLGLDGDAGGAKLKFQKTIGFSTGFALSNSSMPLSTWTHVVGTVSSGGTVTLYVNGTAQSTTGTKTGALANTSVTNIGGTSGYWQGQIQQVIFADREFTPTEITYLYNSGAGRVLMPDTRDLAQIAKAVWEYSTREAQEVIGGFFLLLARYHYLNQGMAA